MKNFNQLLIICSVLSTILLFQSYSKPYCAKELKKDSKVQSSYKDKFAKLSDQFVKESLFLSPTRASVAGYHKHKDPKSGEIIELDSMLDDMSRKAMSNKRQFYSKWQERFNKKTPYESLDTQDKADWKLINDQISLNLLDLENIQSHKYNPTHVVELIGQSIFQPMSSNYAPIGVRMNHVLSRIEQIPRLIKQAQISLKKADPIYIDTAIEENSGNIELIKKSVAKKIDSIKELKDRYNEVSPKAISSLENFSKWLDQELRSNSKYRPWRLGRELYDKKFQLVMQTDIKPYRLLADAEKELKAVRSEMMMIAVPMHMEMFPDHNHTGVKGVKRENLIIGEVLNKIGDDHVKRGELLEKIKSDLNEITSFIKKNQIVSLSKRNNLKVIPTPLFMRGIYSVAGFASAPPLEPTAEAQYWVTPISPETSDKKAESKLREYNNYTLKWLSIHEALPGHYVQFEHLNSIQPERRRLLRSLYANGPYVEGWAEYIAQVMLDEGFMRNSQKFKLIMHKIRLRLLANTILDIKMHTQNMSDKEAMKLMTEDAFQTEAEAEGKLKRAKLSSCQLPTYYVGLKEWLAFRKRYQKTKGDDFNLLKFHNLVLDQGPLPVSYVEKIVTD